MHNSENDPLSLPIVGQDPLILGGNKILVAAAVAAVVLAGSAIVYRHAANASSKDRPRNGLLLKASPSLESHLDVKQNGEYATDSEAMDGLPTTSPSATNTFGQEGDIAVGTSSGQSKSSRSKDRRRRGKDPLKEVLKSGKKLKAIATPGPSSPHAPPNAAAPSSALVSPDFKEELLVSAGPFSSFQSGDSGSSSASTHPQGVIPPQSPPCPSKHRQRAKSATITSATETDVTMLSVSGHSKTSSEASHSILEAEDEALDAEEVDEMPITPNYKQSAHQLYPSPSLTQTSLSPSSAPSSLADASELEQEAGGWISSVSKSRSRNRTRLADVVFEDASVGMCVGVNEDKSEEKTTSGRKGKAKREQHTAETSLTPIPRVSQHGSEPVDAETAHLPPPPPSPSVDAPNGPMLPPPDGISSLVRNTDKAGEAQTQQESSPWGWDATTGPGPASMSRNSNVHSAQLDEVPNPEFKSGDKDDEMTFFKKPPKLQNKGTNGRTSYSSFSSALLEGGGGVGKCGTVAVSIAGSSGSTGVAEGVETMDDSFGVEDGDKEEFTFPTLNPLPSGSNRTRFALNDSPVNSSPSKKTKKSGKSSALSPPSQTSPPSKSSPCRETRYNSGHGNASNADGVIAAQTQLASLKGALEAARQREEKHKEEMEKAMKDMELLKWESTNSRRGEAELQAQVRHLMDQLQSYATLFTTMAPHLGPHLPAAQYLHPQPQIHTKEEQVNESTNSNDNLSDPESSPKADPDLPLPNGDDKAASDCPQPEEEEPKETQEDSVSSLTADEEPVPSTPSQSQSQQAPPLPLSSPPPHMMNDRSHASRYATSPSPSAAVPSPFFPYAMPPYVHVHHPHLPVHPFPWMTSPYQRQHAQTAPQPPFPNVFPPMMYPMSPVPPPLSPPGVGPMSPHLLHQHQPFGYCNGSAGTSSAGSYSPELSGSPGLGMNGKHRPRVKKKKSNMMTNGNARMDWEDVGDGWTGMNGERKGKKGTLEVPSADPEVDADDLESPYSELLADAILKRPGSICPPSGPPLQKHARKENGVFEGQKHQKLNLEAAEEVEQLTEFTFPSLSGFGSSYYRAASRTESSISSSLSSSPPSTTATVPDSIGDPKWEEDRPSLPPVIENAEDLAVPPVDIQGQDMFLDNTVTANKEISAGDRMPPRKHDHEESLTAHRSAGGANGIQTMTP